MKPGFLSDLEVTLLPGDCIWQIDKPLIYWSDIAGLLTVPVGFQTDFASVPRLPIVYEAWGDRAHREAVLHDWMYRIDCVIPITFSEANNIFFEAMTARGVRPWIKYPMYWAVCVAGGSSYHKLKVGDCLQ
jgi:hypothetical protein